MNPFVAFFRAYYYAVYYNCSISAGVQIYSHDTVAWAISGGESQPQKDTVRIGNCCYIGPNAVITKGVTIGDKCIIGANSYVNRDVPRGMKAWGTPVRYQGHVARTIEHKTEDVT